VLTLSPFSPPAFGPAHLDDARAFLAEWGFVTLRGLLGDAEVDAMEAECNAAQAGLIAGELPERYGTTELVDDSTGERTRRFANYVLHVTELSAATDRAFGDPRLLALLTDWLGAEVWRDDKRFGVVYQDARSGPESSYSRIGWHSDWQSGPQRQVWPSVALTFHLDATSPANGFLRVVPGSHRWATPAPYDNVNGIEIPAGSAPWGGYGETPPPFAMPLGFEKVPGEVSVYAERGDVLLHDSYLWHSAARATDDSTTRRHVRGSWFAGERPPADEPSVFVKNAAR
jgi:hypothetical protein